MDTTASISAVVRWYFEEVFAKWEGPGVVPFYCDAERIGHFAIGPRDLASGKEAALFRLFVVMAMFQARRDVVIMDQQREMPREAALSLTSASGFRRRVGSATCEHLASASAFDVGCSVRKSATGVDCDHHPAAPCHVKEATGLLRRMGDMGKLPTSAWLHIGRTGSLTRLLADVVEQEPAPQRRAYLLVERLTSIYRVGEKLATMFVSAVSTPALAPGLTPWFPDVDGNELVVVDTNVARAVDALRDPGAPKTYGARERWVREQASLLDLRRFNPDVPGYSPRLVQQALYAFCSKSNRAAEGDACAVRSTPCAACAPGLCPFAMPAAGPASAVAR